jgi:predicted alpha/beta-hydrolase family hydrolase
VKVVLGPGAFGAADSIRPYVEGLRERGLEALAVDLPRGAAKRAVPAFLAACPPEPVVAGGHSFGGRVASLAALERGFAGLLLFSFPLGSAARARTTHWPLIECPVLVLNGEDDELAPVDELREAVKLLRRGRLLTFAGAGHGLGRALPLALDEAVRFVATLSE